MFKKPKKKFHIPGAALWILLGLAVIAWLAGALVSLFGINVAIITVGLLITGAALVIGAIALAGFFRSLMRR